MLHRRIATLAAAAAIALAACATSPAPVPNSAVPSRAQTRALDALVDEVVASNYSPGIAVGIAAGGRTIYVRATGRRRLDPDGAVTPATPFEIGSVTKQFTSAAILLLAQDGALSIDDRLHAYVPEYAFSRRITLRQLLAMTAGVPANDAAIYDRLDPGKPPSPQIIAALNALPLDYAPGTHMAYSNFGYWLLGEVVRRVSKKSYQRFLADRIFRPNGMRSTYLYGTRNAPHEAIGYAHEFVRDPFVLAPDPPSQFIDAQGGLTSTIGDLLRWDAALTAKTIVRDPLYARMLAVPALQDGGPIPTFTGPGDEGGEILYRLNDGSPSMYAMGWMVPGGNYFWHSGGTNGFTSMNANFDDGTSIVILTNQHLGSVPIGDKIPNLAAKLYQVLHPYAKTPPAFKILRYPHGNPTPDPPTT